jgi:hypothetical protein
MAAPHPWHPRELAPLVVTLLLFVPFCRGAGWVFDDRFMLAPEVTHGWGHVAEHWQRWTIVLAGQFKMYRPLVASLQEAAGLVLGFTPPVFRGLNVALQVANIGLLTRIASRRSAAGWLVGIAAAVHPVCVDPVAWCSDAYDLLAVTGTLLACLAVETGSLAGLVLGLAVALPAKDGALVAAGVAALLAWGTRGAASGDGTGPRVLAGTAIGMAVAWVVVRRLILGESPALPVRPAALVAWLQTAGALVDLSGNDGNLHLFGVEPRMLALGTLVVAGIGAYAVARRAEEAGRYAAEGLATLLLLSVPVAIFEPDFGMAAHRQAYLPVLVAVALLGRIAPPPGLVGARGYALLAAWCLLRAPWDVSRLGDWRTQNTLTLAEAATSPDNPWAARFAAEIDAQLASDRPGRRAALDRWAYGLSATAGAPFRDPAVERDRLLALARSLGEPDWAAAYEAQPAPP